MRAAEILSDISYIEGRFQGILLDAFGVFWGGNALGPLPGVKEIMERLVSSGKVVGILSNSTQLAAKEIIKYQQKGIIQGQHFHFLITSGEVARDVFLNEKLPFASGKNKFWVFGGGHPKLSPHEAIFNGTLYTESPHIEGADFIYISIPHINGEDQIDPSLFKKEISKIKVNNLPMVCANPDQYAHEGVPPRAVVRQGSIAKMYEDAGGYVFYIGKPYDKAFQAAMQCFQDQQIEDIKKILMVGDTPETDIQGALSFGIPSALTVRTGIMADRVLCKGMEAALSELKPQHYPDYFIERL